MKNAIFTAIVFFAFIWSIFLFHQFAEPKTNEEKIVETYDRCVSVLFVNNQAEKIKECEYIKQWPK